MKGNLSSLNIENISLKILMLAVLTIICGYFFEPKIFLTLAAFFAASVANATAIGGGFLFMPLFIFVYKLTPVVALKLSIATQAFGMTSGALAWGRKYIDVQAFFLGSFASVIGVWIATYLWVAPSNFIKPLFAVVSLFVFFALILEMRLKIVDEQRAAKFALNVTAFFFIFFAFFGGLITGWTAIGVGEVVALYLLFFYRLRLDIAIGTGVAVLAVCSIAGLMFHLDLGGIPLELIAFTVPGVILGGRYGAKFAKYIEANVNQSTNQKIIKKSPLKLMFAVVILIDCIVIFLSELVI